MLYYIVAGERSGDLHGSNLVKSIRERDPSAEFRGFGGEYMEQAGVTLAVHYREMAFMGLIEIVTNANKIKRYIRLCKSDILQHKPDVIILIDYGGFNLQIAKFGKKAGLRIFYYIPPKYWAWYQNRALWLRPYVDRLFVILPFEKDFFKKFNWEAEYVGNPVLDAVKAHQPDDQFILKHQIRTKNSVVALLPGSRKQELKTIIPLMEEVVKQFPQYQFAVASVSNLDQSMYGELRSLPNVKFIVEDTYNLLLNSTAAIVTSGTATLETALFRVPQVVVYKANFISYWIARMMIKVPHISLVNLIIGKQVVKELIQKDANVKEVSTELRQLLEDQTYRQGILNAYDNLIKILDTGSASENAANLMVRYLRNDLVNLKS